MLKRAFATAIAIGDDSLARAIARRVAAAGKDEPESAPESLEWLELATALWKSGAVLLDADPTTPNNANRPSMPSTPSMPNMTNVPKALNTLQEALTIARAKVDTIEPEVHAAIEFDLARALWFTDPREATTHATAARTLFLGLGESQRAELGRVDAWLATHAPGR